jgi:hypothetical protein
VITGRDLALYWAKYMTEHGTSATLTAMPKDRIDEIFKACDDALDEGNLGDMEVWVYSVLRDIHSGFYQPKWADVADDGHTTDSQPYRAFVYLLWTSAGMYKIGYTSNPKSRLATYKAMPFQCGWVCLIESTDARNLESQLLERFKDKVLPPKREWFALNDEDVEYIKSLGVQA